MGSLNTGKPYVEWGTSNSYDEMSEKEMPVKPTKLSFDEARQGRIFVRQGRLSRHKVSVGEPADGSPPKI
jgi:hypothetical protein